MLKGAATMRNAVLGMDIGGTHMRMGFVDESLQLSGYNMAPSSLISGTGAAGRLAVFVKEYIEKTGILPSAVSVGFPSTLDKQRRVLLSTPNIEGLSGVPAAKIMEEELGLPVFINRDVNLLFLYDCHVHQLHGPGVNLGIYVGTGLGNVISINGEILVGKNGVAAELGHIPGWQLNAPCPCGNTGCLEMYASGKHLKEIRDQYFPQTPIGELFIRHGVEAQLQAFVECLSIPIATEINILDPDHIILGGGVLQMEGFPTELLEKYIYNHARKPYPADNLHILYSNQAQENGVIGAAIHGYLELEK